MHPEKPISRLAIGTVSKNVIRAVYSYSHDKSIPLMLIASKSQIDYDSGYVMSTAEFKGLNRQLIKNYPNSTVYICRDHCGPGFNGRSDLNDVYETISNDLENEFDLIHIDFSRHLKGYEDSLKESIRAIEFIEKLSPSTLIEVGTEDNIGFNFAGLERVQREIKIFRQIHNLYFYTCQTGSLVQKDRQSGIFRQKYVEQVREIVSKHKIFLKEHNADYLSDAGIKKRKDLVDAINIAPQLGVLQTKLTLALADRQNIATADYLNKCYKSGFWKKWITDTTLPSRNLSILAGHYNFNTKEYKQLVQKIEKGSDFETILQNEIYSLLDQYLRNF